MSNTANRDALLKLASLLRPALSTQTYIPAYQHIRFAGGQALAFNDVTAITIRTALDLEACVPGELMIKALSSFNADEVLLQQDVKNGVMALVSGRARVKMPTMAVKDFPFDNPDDGSAYSLNFTDAMLTGVEACLFNVGKDPTHGAQMGVTLDTVDGAAALYSTDNFTISRFRTTTKLKMPGDAPVILPTFFCEQLIELAGHFKDQDITLEIAPNYLRATFGKQASLLTKSVNDLEPLDFQSVLGRLVDFKTLDRFLVDIPNGFDSAWDRALLVMAGTADKVSRVRLENNKLMIDSESSMGEAHDELSIKDADGEHSDFYIDPSFVVRAASKCAKMAFCPRGLVLTSETGVFTHFITHSFSRK